jgi:hypothetical protein
MSAFLLCQSRHVFFEFRKRCIQPIGLFRKLPIIKHRPDVLDDTPLREFMTLCELGEDRGGALVGKPSP